MGEEIGVMFKCIHCVSKDTERFSVLETELLYTDPTLESCRTYQLYFVKAKVYLERSRDPTILIIHFHHRLSLLASSDCRDKF